MTKVKSVMLIKNIHSSVVTLDKYNCCGFKMGILGSIYCTVWCDAFYEDE